MLFMNSTSHTLEVLLFIFSESTRENYRPVGSNTDSGSKRGI